MTLYLRYTIKKDREWGDFTKLTVLPYQFSKPNYGFALKDNSPYDKKFNQALLKVRKSPEWQKALYEDFGGF